MPCYIVRLGSTNVDRHGEKFSRDFFARLIQTIPHRVPLHRNHDLSQPSAGFLESHRLEPDAEHSGEWALLADLTIPDELPEEDIREIVSRGFSWTATAPVSANCAAPVVEVFLPLPYYRNEANFSGLLDLGVPLGVGRLHRKEWTSQQVITLVVATLSLTVSAASLILGPLWRRLYEDHVHAVLGTVLIQLRGLSRSRRPGEPSLSTDLVLRLPAPARAQVEVVLVPTRGMEDDCFSRDVVLAALDLAAREVESSPRGEQLRRVRMLHDSATRRYAVLAMEFEDGETIHFVD